MEKKLSNHNVMFILISIIFSMTSILVFMVMNTKIINTSFLIIIMNALIIIISTHKSWRYNDLFQPIMFINIFLFFVFVLRPIKLLLANNLHEISYFKYYFHLYGSHSITELPIVKALYLGFLGIATVNISYWFIRNRTLKKKLRGTYYKFSQEKKKNIEIWNNIFLFVGFLILFLYLYKSIGQFVNVVYSTKDILWIYIFSIVVLIEQNLQKKINIKILLLLLVSMISLSIIGNRQLIINLMISIFIPYYYIREKKINIGIIILGILMLLIVVWYGSMRRGDILGLDTFIESLMKEFTMFDMLVLGIDHKEKTGSSLYFGYNYFVFLNYIIPGLSIPFFDFQHVQDVFQGLIGGGIPTTLIGSLYFNFSYFGVIIGSIVIGIFSAKKYHKYIYLEKPEAIIYYSMFVTFVYDIIRVGDIGREIVNYLILFGVFKIAIFFINKIKII